MRGGHHVKSRQVLFRISFPVALDTLVRQVMNNACSSLLVALNPTAACCCLSLLQVAQHSDREALYKELTESPGVIWAASEVGSRRIDEINILEATKEAMTVSFSLPFSMFGCLIGFPVPSGLRLRTYRCLFLLLTCVIFRRRDDHP